MNRRRAASSSHARGDRHAVAALARRLRWRLPDYSPELAVLAGFMAATALLGGGSRSDIASLMVLRPLSAMVLGYALLRLTWADITANRWLLGLGAGVVVLVGSQLVPLPPGLANSLPGHAVAARIDRLAGLEGVWRPLSLAPTQTWNAFWSLMAPLAVGLLALRLDNSDHRRLVSLLLAIGLFDALLGVAQLTGEAGAATRLYADTNSNSSVGLFANRNHQAVFLSVLLPLTACWAANGRSRRGKGRGERHTRPLMLLGLGLCTLPLILITGSRAGIFTGLLGLVIAPAVAGWKVVSGWMAPAGGAPRALRIRRALQIGVPALVAATIAVTIWSQRATALVRLAGHATGTEGEMRLRTLPAVLDMAREALPWGAGAGSFKQVFRLHEGDDVLAPALMNHAHNDWLELIAQTGWGGILLAAGFAVLCAFAARRAWGSNKEGQAAMFARLGLATIGILWLASLFDYPLRVPTLSCYFALAAVWACRKE